MIFWIGRAYIVVFFCVILLRIIRKTTGQVHDFFKLSYVKLI